jgi:hypothetical protein
MNVLNCGWEGGRLQKNKIRTEEVPKSQIAVTVEKPFIFLYLWFTAGDDKPPLRVSFVILRYTSIFLNNYKLYLKFDL